MANMANRPEHDFAPAWLKIPSNQQSSKQPQVNHNSQGGRPGYSEDKYRSRNYSTDSQYGFGRSPTHEQFSSFRGRDEHRSYSTPSTRHHSIDDLPWDPDPTTNWNYSQFSDNSSHGYGTGCPRRGSSVPRNSQQYSNNGRFDGRGPFHQGKSAGSERQRYNSGPKSSYTDDHGKETSGKKEESQGDGGDETGKESDNKSALSNQDFPSLLGAGDDTEQSVPTKSSVPSGAWEKPPGTTKIISGRKLQLIKKSIPSSSESKSSTRTVNPSSTPAVDINGGSKVAGQSGSSGQSSKVMASSNVSSSVVLKSMTSVTPMGSSRSKEPAIRSAPVPTSRISPVPSKTSQVAAPSRSAPIPINPSSTPITKASINKIPVTKTPTPKSAVNNAAFNNSPTNKSTISASTKPLLSSITSSVPSSATPAAPVAKKTETSSDKASHSSPAIVKSMPVLVDSSKSCSAAEKLATSPSKSSVISVPAASKRSTPASNRPTPSPNRPALLSNRPASAFPRPSPMSSSRQTPGPAPVVSSISTPAVPRSGPVGSANTRKDKTLPENHASTLQPLLKGPPSPIYNSSTPMDVPLRSPTNLKPKKGNKLDFLNELRRSSNGDVSKEVSQHNQENLRGKEEGVWRRNGPSAMPKTILQRDHSVIKTNGIKIHNNLTAMEKGSEDEAIPNFYPVFSPIRDGPDISSSLEAEKRLLQEMGWHEHSDNEEGYAPLTEDELKEFQKKSQQLKKNGLTKALPAAWNSVSLPIGSINQVSLEDGFTSSDSDSSDDDTQS